jgi:hypothetical protein
MPSDQVCHRNHSSSSVQSTLTMTSSNNRFALLEDEAEIQPEHGAEDALESPVSTIPEMKCKKKKKKKAKRRIRIPPDGEEDITHTTRYCIL